MTAAPRRRVVVEIKLGADSWEEVVQALEQMAFEVATGGLRGNAVSGGPSAGYTWKADEDETVTHESYMAAIGGLP